MMEGTGDETSINVKGQLSLHKILILTIFNHFTSWNLSSLGSLGSRY